MKILQVHARYRWPGGEETTVNNDAQALSNGGHHVVQYVVENPTSLVGSLASLSAAPWNLRQIRAVHAKAKSEGVDVIHVHNTWFALSSGVLTVGRSLDAPTVTTIQNYRLACAQGQMIRDGAPCQLCLGSSAVPGVRYRCYRDSAVMSAWNSISTRSSLRLGVWSEVSAAIVPARFTADILVSAGLPRERVVVRPNTAPDPGDRVGTVEKSDIVLFVGRLSPEKGVANLLAGWRASAPKDLRLVVVGDGPERSLLENEASEDVSFLGHRSPAEIRQLMLRARALAFPSVWYEVCPLVIIEAFAAGLPVLGHPIGAVTEMLDPLGPDAFVAEPSPQAWKDAIERISDDNVVRRLGGLARASYTERNTPTVGRRSLERIYREAIRQ